MKLPTKQALWEAFKEVARLAFFAALAAVVGWLADKVNLLDPTSVYYVLATAALRFADKYVHENKNIDSKGIAPF